MESDLIQAKALIYDKTGRMPVLVRPPYGDYGKDKPEEPLILQTYARQHLTMQLWTVDTEDWKKDDALILLNLSNTGCSTMTCGIPYWIRKGKTSIVLLFHDVQENTVINLEKYLKFIEDVVQHEGRNVRFEQF